MTMTTAQADIVVRDRQGNLAAWVEVKAGPPLTDQAMAWLRDNVLREIPRARYFLIVSEDRTVVWQLAEDGRSIERELSCPMDAVISAYWPSRPPGHKLDFGQLQFIARFWLMDLSGAFPDELTDESSRCLAASGLVAAIHGGAVLAEARL